ncbi:MAG TPA: phosphorylase [Azoarcus taiwanensis]|uniref:Phosphorylase n=1 Tax=Azoarcus taiwanensis TaxID=666964 RepID=A0A972FA70_9RHOO|nr:phosphorylase [Azoarcus taiwanensis]NMG02954.1 phosphorylase [Azoarcus taiwanensis]HRQ58440.1 phosphorylase [Azoarcus taiwanensis]
MNGNWMDAIDVRSASALASGDLQPVQADETEMTDGGMRFIVRWVSSLAAKDAVKKDVAVPGGPRDPAFNPFLNPDPALTVGPVGEAHVAILNKFPLCARHLVLARREFEEQLSPLVRIDFDALATIMGEAGGLGLYNGGVEAGASQRHKHVQWIPEAPGNASLKLYAPGLPTDAEPQTVARHPALAMKHCFVRVECGKGVAVDRAGASMHAGFERARAELDLAPGPDGLLPPCNLLLGDGWLLMLPRSREHFEGISFSAVCFGGTLYTRHRDQIDAIRSVGPLQAMAAVGC